MTPSPSSRPLPQHRDAGRITPANGGRLEDHVSAAWRALGRVAALALLGAGLLVGGTAHAATFSVNETQDLGDANPGDGLCAVAPAGSCSLRAAVQEAAALPGEDTVGLPAATFELLSPLAFSATDARTNVVGAGRGATTVTTATPLSSTALPVDAGAGVALSRLTVRASGVDPLTVVRGELDLDDVALDGGVGGLVHIHGRARLRDVSARGNSAASTPINVLTGATLDWERGTLANSSAGGVFNGGTTRLVNVTLFENEGDPSGGTNLWNDRGTLTAVHVTVKADHDDPEGEPAVQNEPGGTLSMRNSIVEGMCVGGITTLGGNVESGSSCGFSGATDAQNADPQLGPLADNGGPTLTLAIPATSPAANRGSACPATDQRGVVRGDPCDAGAYEIPDDRTPPVLALPGPIAVDATGPGGAAVSYAASASDAVDGAVPVSCAPPSGATFPIGDTTVSCEATDAAGNRATGSFTVRVRGAAEQIARLKDTVRSFNRPAVVTLALLTPLRTAEASLAGGHTAAACASLAAFIAEARLLSGTGLTPAQSARLVADARRIRAVLDCG